MGTSTQTDSGSSLNAFNIAMIVIPVIAVALRFWSRLLSERSKVYTFWWDDWTILMALPLNIVTCALHIYAVSLGLGKHISTIPKGNIEQLLKVLWITYWFGDVGLALPKASVLFFYTRVLTSHNRAFKYGIWLGHLLNFLWWVGAVARCLLFCTPPARYWDRSLPGICRSADALYIGSAVPSVVIDFYILLLPLPIIWKLSLKTSRKILVAGVFLCGYLVITISLGRLITSLKSGRKLDEDLTYNGVPLIFWVTAEPAISIIGCCIPSIFYLGRRISQDGLLSLFGRPASKYVEWKTRSSKDYQLQADNYPSSAKYSATDDRSKVEQYASSQSS